MLRFALVTVVVLSMSAASAAAAPWRIDTEQSHITIESSIDGIGVGVPQSPGSLTTQFAGTLDIELTSDSIQFLGGLTVEALEHPGPFLPFNAPAALAGMAVIVPDVLIGYEAFRDMMVGVSSAVLPLDAAGEFDAGSLSLLSNLSNDVMLGELVESFDVVLNFTNRAEGVGSVSQVGSRTVVTLPFEGNFSNSEYGFTIRYHLQGQIVAFVPEPGSLTLALAGAAAMLGYGMRRRRGA